MSRCDLDLWNLDLKLSYHFGCHAFKLCTKFERNRLIHGWVIDDLARFRRTILGVGHVYRSVLRVAFSQLHQTRREHRTIMTKQEICFRIRISCFIFKRGLLKVEWRWKTTPNFALFSERELKFMFAICHRPSVCRLSVVCLSVVCNVRAPYSDDWNFRQCFYAVGYLGHLLTSR